MRSRLSSRRGDWKTVGLYFKDMRVLQDGDEDYPEATLMWQLPARTLKSFIIQKRRPLVIRNQLTRER